MIAWNCRLRLSSSLRRWIETLRTALHHWYCTSQRRLPGRILLFYFP